ncbi:MAG: sigma-54-dependent Fis family transcriptional regulator, partial [Chitinophagaceae bacterium]|nr:sigma-54-dependent Fis family transcriptional regulator [Chitinophagaceae bacterium]
MSLKNSRVLAVDDDSDVLIAIKMLLKNECREIAINKNPELIPSLLG